MKIVKCLFLTAMILQTLGLTAQTSVGLRAGIHLATISEIQEITTTNVDPEYITGMNFAIFADLGLSEVFAIQPELNFLQKGSEITLKDVEGHSDFGIKVVVNYLEVPVLAKLKFGTDRLKVFALLGPSIGYAMGGNASTTVHGKTTKDKIDFDTDINDDGVKDQRWDVSGVLGAGGMLAAGPGSLILDLRYNMDFTDFSKFKDSTPAGYDKSYNRGFGISLGYQIPLVKS